MEVQFQRPVTKNACEMVRKKEAKAAQKAHEGATNTEPASNTFFSTAGQP